MSKVITINPHGVEFAKRRKTSYLMFLHLLKNKSMPRKELEKIVFRTFRGRLKFMGTNFQHHTRENRFEVQKEGRTAIYALTTAGKQYAEEEFGLTPTVVESVEPTTEKKTVKKTKKVATPAVAKKPAKKKKVETPVDAQV